MSGLIRRMFGARNTLTAAEARQALADGALLLDVREPAEWQAGHVAGAVHIPLRTLGHHLSDLPADRLIVVACRSGRRSAIAAGWLARQSFRVANLDHGLTAWQAAGLPLVTDRGTPGEVS